MTGNNFVHTLEQSSARDIVIVLLVCRVESNNKDRRGMQMVRWHGGFQFLGTIFPNHDIKTRGWLVASHIYRINLLAVAKKTLVRNINRLICELIAGGFDTINHVTNASVARLMRILVCGDEQGVKACRKRYPPENKSSTHTWVVMHLVQPQRADCEYASRGPGCHVRVRRTSTPPFGFDTLNKD